MLYALQLSRRNAARARALLRAVLAHAGERGWREVGWAAGGGGRGTEAWMGGGGEGGARRGGAGVTWQETVAVLKCIASVNWRILAVTSGEEGAGEVRALEEKALESAIAGLVAQPVDKVYDVAQDAIARFSQ